MSSPKHSLTSRPTGLRPDFRIGLFTLTLMAAAAAGGCQSGDRSATSPGEAVRQQDFPTAPDIPSGPVLAPGPQEPVPDPSSTSSWSPNVLDGAWEGDYWRINARGASLVRDTLVISSVKDGLLEATRSWKTLEGVGGHKGLTPVKSDVEELLGVFVALTGQIRFVEMNEPGTLDGQLVDRDTLELFSTQPGRQPSISHQRLTRVTGPASGS